ncbi:hypothetical protein NQ314_007913 [Rhamnusium bicolor]|uniref:Alpha-taxilin n=1 Tax=Rhamnusium bicolor TaxID=1586634 RepID=A0AAV8YG21_9CUCU|nr:hypothetical protein NQ314_007913 [Rhamnusium bicolor]
MGDENPMSASTGAIKKKKDEKARRRDQRSWENIIRSVSTMSEGEKIAVIQEKYNEIYAELRKATSTLAAMEKQYAALQKERDHTQTELTKNILAKAKLESLCRELQKQNKVIKEENITRVKEEEEKRREVATNFTEKLNSLTTLMDENKDKSVRLREENMSMTTKLTELYDQFQEREGHLTNMNRQMDLQKQLSETQFEKLQVEFDNERKIWDQERQVLTDNLERSEQTNSVLEANLKSLQDHLDVYKGQYTDFESTMAKSSKVFDAFKAEMSILQKSNSTLEQERDEYLSRWQACTNSIIQISEIHQQATADIKKYEKKVPVLERICRVLQAERSAYQKQLVENNITPVFVPPPPEDQPEVPHPSTSSPPPTVSRKTKKKLTKKEKLLVALKSELRTMEDQLKQELAKENQDKCQDEEESSSGELDDEPQPGPSSSQPDLTVEKGVQIPLKAAKSCPVITHDQKHANVEAYKSSSSSSSTENLLAELSLDAIPLYKPEGVTDIIQGEQVCLVKESEGLTDLLEPPPDGDQVATDESQEVQVKSAVTIPLKEAVGKTDINKEP